MKICPCMYSQNKNGDSVCRKCNGDIYSCDCSLVHLRSCSHKSMAKCGFCCQGQHGKCTGSDIFILKDNGRQTLDCDCVCKEPDLTKRVAEANRFIRVLGLGESYKLVKR